MAVMNPPENKLEKRTKFPGAMFIQGATFIPDSRVGNIFQWFALL